MRPTIMRAFAVALSLLAALACRRRSCKTRARAQIRMSRHATLLLAARSLTSSSLPPPLCEDTLQRARITRSNKRRRAATLVVASSALRVANGFQRAREQTRKSTSTQPRVLSQRSDDKDDRGRRVAFCRLLQQQRPHDRAPLERNLAAVATLVGRQPSLVSARVLAFARAPPPLLRTYANNCRARAFAIFFVLFSGAPRTVSALVIVAATTHVVSLWFASAGRRRGGGAAAVAARSTTVDVNHKRESIAASKKNERAACARRQQS